MRTFDFTPLLRSGIGFDRFDRVLENLSRQDQASPNYPPYNIAKSGENNYQISMAVAGFGEDDIEIVAEENSLEIKAKAQEDKEGVTYLHRGIAGRGFERRFQLADDIRVTGARLEHGLLHIDLLREVPEQKRPRKIEIGGASQPKSLGKAA
jgi:molecular chaperone IbpA